MGRPAKYNKRPSHDLDACGSEDDEVEATISRGTPTPNLGISNSQPQTRPASYDSPGGSPLLQMQVKLIRFSVYFDNVFNVIVTVNSGL